MLKFEERLDRRFTRPRHPRIFSRFFGAIRICFKPITWYGVENIIPRPKYQKSKCNKRKKKSPKSCFKNDSLNHDVTLLGALPHLASLAGIRRGGEGERRVRKSLILTSLPFYGLPHRLYHSAPYCLISNRKGLSTSL